MPRGYYWANAYNGGNGGNGFDTGGPMTAYGSPATVFDIVEGKDFGSDVDAWSDWVQDVDSTRNWMGAASPNTKLQWTNTGDKWAGMAQTVAYMDSHAKRASFGQTCAKQGPGQLDAFNITADIAPQFLTGWGWAQDATLHWNYCANIPQKFR